jgi:hypothetical protein
VHHAGSACGIQGGGHIVHDASGLSRREAALTQQFLAQALPGHLIHHIIEKPVRASRRMHRHNVRMAEPGDHSGLGEKAPGDGLVGGKLGMNDFDRDFAVQGGVGCQEDNTHATTT